MVKPPVDKHPLITGDRLELLKALDNGAKKVSMLKYAIKKRWFPTYCHMKILRDAGYVTEEIVDETETVNPGRFKKCRYFELTQRGRSAINYFKNG